MAAKALNQFAGEHPDALSIKGGLLEGSHLPRADVARLARLPAREQLLGQLAGGLAAPLSGLAGTLNSLIGGLARTLAALQAQRGDGPLPRTPSGVRTDRFRHHARERRRQNDDD